MYENFYFELKCLIPTTIRKLNIHKEIGSFYLSFLIFIVVFHFNVQKAVAIATNVNVLSIFE